MKALFLAGRVIGLGLVGAIVGAALGVWVSVLEPFSLEPLQAFPGSVVDCTATTDGCHLYGGQMVEHTLYNVDSAHPLRIHVDGQGEIKLFDVTAYQVDDNQIGCTPGVIVDVQASRGWVYLADVRLSGQGYGSGGTGAKCPRLLVDGSVGHEGTHFVGGIVEGTATGVYGVHFKWGRMVIDGTLFNKVGGTILDESPGPCWCYPIIGTLK